MFTARMFLAATALLVACGAPPPQMSTSVLTPTMPDPTSPTTSMNILGSCTEAHGSDCSNGAGMCLHSQFGDGVKQCVKKCTGDQACPGGAFCAAFNGSNSNAGVCLDRCASVRDCSSNQFCNTTVLQRAAKNTREAEEVTVCIPGVHRRDGDTCTSQSSCEAGATDLKCVGATSSSPGICTKSCTSSSECGEATCVKDSSGKGTCLAPCSNGYCLGNLACISNFCFPKSSQPSGMMTKYPTPAPGTVGGSCTAGSCEGALVCLTSRPNGLCSKSCSSSTECGSTGVCMIQQDGSGACMARCDTPGAQSTCRTGYQCRAIQGQTDGYCL